MKLSVLPHFEICTLSLSEYPVFCFLAVVLCTPIITYLWDSLWFLVKNPFKGCDAIQTGLAVYYPNICDFKTVWLALKYNEQTEVANFNFILGITLWNYLKIFYTLHFCLPDMFIMVWRYIHTHTHTKFTIEFENFLLQSCPIFVILCKSKLYSFNFLVIFAFLSLSSKSHNFSWSYVWAVTVK